MFTIAERCCLLEVITCFLDLRRHAIILCLGDRFDNLHGDKAIFNLRVRDALHIAVFNLLKGHQLVIILVKLGHDILYERLLVGMHHIILVELLLVEGEICLCCRR